MRQLSFGFFAHVDAGKTTLSEQLLYRAHSIRSLGRVDHGSSFLDTDREERSRGITIYSSQASFVEGDVTFTLIDTPGHADFSAEMERALSVIDCAVVVVSAISGVQGHTRTIFRELRRRGVPVLFFLNKLDLPTADREGSIVGIRELCGEGLMDFAGWETPDEAFSEELAMLDEGLMERYLAGEPVKMVDASRLFMDGRLYPMLGGAALAGEGVAAVPAALSALCVKTFADEGEPRGRCYKVMRDEKGVRLCLCRLTAGHLRVRDLIGGEKTHELRRFAGAKSAAIAEVAAGEFFAAAGLSLRPGEGFGGEESFHAGVTPTLTAEAVCAAGDERKVLAALRELADEEPTMAVDWAESIRQISVRVCGVMQLEVLQARLAERFGLAVSFGEARVVYRETLAASVIGRGHYEPLRHYAEVHLRLSPGERGAGITFSSEVSTDVLLLNWQRLIQTHVFERKFRGVLTGSELTDVHVTLLAGRAHLKHTEGGDFRESVYRAIRQGLLKGESLLLEPWQRFQIEAPTVAMGRVMAGLQQMQAEVEPPLTRGADVVFVGRAPAKSLLGYARTLAELTGGQGSLSLAFDAWEPVRDQEAVVESMGYAPIRDPEETGDSVFCAHGAGFVVPWHEADGYMDLGSK